MSDAIVTHHRTCKCGHDRASHFEGTVHRLHGTEYVPVPERITCLCRGVRMPEVSGIDPRMTEQAEWPLR